MIGDFDFYVGTWDVANRRLTKRLAGSDHWKEFPAVSVARSFFDGAGTFDDTPITVRFRWSNISATTAHWEQAFSADGGGTWETNWIMDSTRRDSASN